VGNSMCFGRTVADTKPIVILTCGRRHWTCPMSFTIDHRLFGARVTNAL